MKNQISVGALNRTVKTAGIAYVLIIIVPLLSMLLIDPKISVSNDVIACTLQDEFIIPCPKFGTN